MSVLIKFVHRQEILDVSEELGEASFIPQVGARNNSACFLMSWQAVAYDNRTGLASETVVPRQ